MNYNCVISRFCVLDSSGRHASQLGLGEADDVTLLIYGKGPVQGHVRYGTGMESF